MDRLNEKMVEKERIKWLHRSRKSKLKTGNLPSAEAFSTGLEKSSKVVGAPLDIGRKPAEAEVFSAGLAPKGVGALRDFVPEEVRVSFQQAWIQKV